MKIYLIVLGALLLVACGTRSGSNAQLPSEAPAAVKAADSTQKVIAYYFYTTKRCGSCLKIENYSKEALDRNFAEAMETGQLEWRMVNTDEEENKHYIDDYSLFTKSLILVEMKDGAPVRWKQCGKVWEYLNDKPKFLDYVKREVQAYLTAS